MSPRLVALVLGLGFVLACRLLASTWLPAAAGDFELLYASAASLLRGETPYPESQWLPYPLPAVLLVVPFTAIPLELARPVFDVLVGWAFVFALWKYRGAYALLALLSGSYLFALLHGQTTPLMAAASLIPALGFLLAVRPTTSVALWVARPSLIGFAGAAGFVALSLAVQPTWPVDWWMTFPEDYSAWMPPILRPFGALLLLGALRWSCPEGRLMLATALLPQTALPYELVPLALIPGNRAEMALYLAGTWLVVANAAGVLQLPAIGEWTLNGWPVMLSVVYLPMLVLVLRRPGCKGGPWIGKERRRPHRLPDDEVEIAASVDDRGRIVVTVTHVVSRMSMTESGPTREVATRKAHDKLAALLARTNRLAKKDAPPTQRSVG
ncbi:MAG TPA: hypothetical protein VHH32_06560 [Gemmatimonadales bacterium]|nr:hypothetical protein [Gemmatimonadales bacterium]